MTTRVGIVGLGNMGAALAANLVESGLDVTAFDLRGAERAPAGARWAEDVDALVDAAELVVLSLPDGAASLAVAKQIAQARSRRARVVVDTSTIGLAAARAVADVLEAAGLDYVDAPVSGGPAGARARTLAVMYAGSDAACAAAEPALAGLSDARTRVGDRPGLGQAMKLANNFLSATALAATSEARTFGTAHGLDPATMIAVLNASSGRNSATDDKFPNHVLTGRYASGFAAALMAKDVGLYLEAARETGGSTELGDPVVALWRRFGVAEPDADFTRIHPFVAGKG